MRIVTGRLILISCSRKILHAALESNHALAHTLHINIPENWTEFGRQAFEFALERISLNEAEQDCWHFSQY